jgi:hypothetical protein
LGVAGDRRTARRLRRGRTPSLERNCPCCSQSDSWTYGARIGVKRVGAVFRIHGFCLHLIQGTHSAERREHSHPFENGRQKQQQRSNKQEHSSNCTLPTGTTPPHQHHAERHRANDKANKAQRRGICVSLCVVADVWDFGRQVQLLEELGRDGVCVGNSLCQLWLAHVDRVGGAVAGVGVFLGHVCEVPVLKDYGNFFVCARRLGIGEK